MPTALIVSPFPWFSTLALASIYVCRMLGLFMILPVFSPYSETLTGNNSFLMGLALGGYGLAQVCFQLPMGVWSDRWGRKPVMTVGLLLFFSGSLLAGHAHHIAGVILGRALQGSGAISGVVLALVADVTPVAHRMNAMAIIGVSIGVSFVMAMILGPVLSQWFGVQGLFYITAGLSILSLCLLHTAVPTPMGNRFEVTSRKTIKTLLQTFMVDLKISPALKLLYASVFFLHLILTALFVVLPLFLQKTFHFNAGEQAQFYAWTLIAAFLPLGIFMGIFRRKRGLLELSILKWPVLGLALACALWFGLPISVWGFSASMVLFFLAFGFLEANLPALLSLQLPEAVRGTGLSLFSMSQFFGAFCGGVGGGALLGWSDPNTVLVVLAMLAGLWFFLLFRYTRSINP